MIFYYFEGFENILPKGLQLKIIQLTNTGTSTETLSNVCCPYKIKQLKIKQLKERLLLKNDRK